MTIERWIPSESDLSIPDSLDVIAEKLYRLEQLINDRRTTEFLTKTSISLSGTFNTTKVIQVEASSFIGSFAYLGFVCTNGASSLTIKASDALKPAGFSRDMVVGDMDGILIPLKSPGLNDLTLNLSGTVTISTFDLDIEPVMFSL